ncbi:MAG: ribosomal large subunit pseudouridine synthase [bacterium]|nr:ribosomal large subunit pseudouridine synthase [bacterium]
MKKRVLRRASDDPALLCDLLVARLALTFEAALEIVDHGGVYIDGKRVTARRYKVAVGEQVTVHLMPATPVAPPIVVLHRDEDLAIVEKPAGLPSQAETGQRTYCLDAMATRDLGPEARLMHRLDKEASGLVLVALQASAYAPLQRAMAAHEIDRRYIAVVDGELRGEGTIRKRIGRHVRDQRLRTSLPEDAPAGEAACTHYRTLAHGALDGRALTAVELRLETGRTHQIRVHLWSIEHAIVGDAAYGGPPFERMCLHAYVLEVRHPRHGRLVRVSAHLPDSFAQLVPGLTRPFT